MPADFDKCVRDGGRVRTMKLKGNKYMHVCYDTAGKSHSGEVKTKKELRWDTNFILEDFTPEDMEAYKNHQTDDKGAGKSWKGKKIKGGLLRKESRNGRIYELDAMIKAEQLAKLPLPISMNHGDDVSDNVGLITKLLPHAEGLDYEGIVFNTAKYPDAIEMMQKGLISKISIEADNPLEEEHDGKVIIKGFDLMGAGFVKYAGIPQASASIAEAIENNEEVEDVEDTKDLDAKLAKIEAFEQAEKKKLVEEAEKKRLAEEAEKKELKESLLALQTEVKALKEKKSGIITTDTPSNPQILETYTTTKRDGRPDAFVFEGRGTDKASFWPVRPEEYY